MALESAGSAKSLNHLNQVLPKAGATDRLAVALDFPTSKLALALVDSLEGRCRWFKVGMELFYATGPSFLHTLRERGFEVFLDLKLHDIPNTVAGAVRSAAQTGASLLTIHAAGGERMMQAAMQAAEAPGAPALLAVTVLTSMDATDLSATGVDGDVAAQVMRLSRLARATGVPGLVCSPRELASLRKEFGSTPLLVVPGIRSAEAEAGDQRRIATPASAIRDGASLLVVGRPITQAPDPAAAADAILQEIELEIEAAIGTVVGES